MVENTVPCVGMALDFYSNPVNIVSATHTITLQRVFSIFQSCASWVLCRVADIIVRDLRKVFHIRAGS